MRRERDILSVLRKEAGGSFSMIYMALEAIRKKTGQFGHSATLKLSDVIDEINRLKRRRPSPPTRHNGS